MASNFSMKEETKSFAEKDDPGESQEYEQNGPYQKQLPWTRKTQHAERAELESI